MSPRDMSACCHGLYANTRGTQMGPRVFPRTTLLVFFFLEFFLGYFSFRVIRIAEQHPFFSIEFFLIKPS